MSDYTPTDEAIRDCYVHLAPATGETAREEFDRWLEGHDRQVAAGTLTGVAQAYYENGGTQTAVELLEIAKRIGAGEGS